MVPTSCPPASPTGLYLRPPRIPTPASPVGHLSLVLVLSLNLSLPGWGPSLLLKRSLTTVSVFQTRALSSLSQISMGRSDPLTLETPAETGPWWLLCACSVFSGEPRLPVCLGARSKGAAGMRRCPAVRVRGNGSSRPAGPPSSVPQGVGLRRDVALDLCGDRVAAQPQAGGRGCRRAVHSQAGLFLRAPGILAGQEKGGTSPGQGPHTCLGLSKTEPTVIFFCLFP